MIPCFRKGNLAERKTNEEETDVFTNAYWCLATAIYLGLELLERKMGFYLDSVVVAGVLYAALLGIVKVL